MKDKNLTGGILASISALMGIIGHFVLFLKWYQVGMHTQSAEPGCEILLKYIHPALTDLGIFAGVPICSECIRLFHQKELGFSAFRPWHSSSSDLGVGS